MIPKPGTQIGTQYASNPGHSVALLRKVTKCYQQFAHIGTPFKHRAGGSNRTPAHKNKGLIGQMSICAFGTRIKAGEIPPSILIIKGFCLDARE
jgi:hypothetical protein